MSEKGKDQNVAKTIKNSDALDLKIVQSLVENPTLTDEALASTLGVARMTINRRRNQNGVKSLLADTLSIPSDELRRLMVKSLKRIEELLDDSDPRIRAFAATQLLKIGVQLKAAGLTDNLSGTVETVCLPALIRSGSTSDSRGKGPTPKRPFSL